MRILSFLTALLSFLSQSTPRQTAPVVQRDPQALAILNQAVASSGGLAALSAVQDFTGNGTITYHWAGQEVVGSVEVLGKGLDEFRMDATLSDGARSLIINGTAGLLILQNGQRTKLPFYSVMTAGSLTFPATRIAAALHDSSTSLSFLGLVNRNGSQVYKVHVTPPIDSALRVGKPLSGLGEFDLFISTGSPQILALSEFIWWDNDLSQSYLHEIDFSNYASINGLSMPLAMTEKFGGQQTWAIALTSMTFNNGLSDSLFGL
jgi:hypothetical protein